MTDKETFDTVVRVGSLIFGGVLTAVIKAIEEGEDLEQLISTLPTADQQEVRDALAREKTRRDLVRARDEILGE